jgi:hypothetical protein
MNMKVLVNTATVVALVLVCLVAVRIGLDGISQTSALVHNTDTVAGWALSVVGFAVSLPVLLFGGDLPGSGIPFLLCGILVSSLAWGIVVERLVHVAKRKAT